VSAVLLAEHADAQVYHASWRELLDALPRREDGTVCDALIVDAPYSERTHAGQRHGRRDEVCNGEWVSARGLPYAHWSACDVEDFVCAWSPATRGWFVTLTDSPLVPAWERALNGQGRCVFAPLPLVQIGMNVRLAGDGPSNWTCWIVVARPRGLPYSKWGTLRGAYVGHPFDAGENTATASRRSLVVGGKPRWVMERLVEDYSRPGDLVVDPCCGAGTTLVAAQRTSRQAVGGDAMLEHAELAAKRISKAVQTGLFVEAPAAPEAEQLDLVGGER
jgi:hypothetical protein